MSKFLDKIIERAKTDKQKIVLPEGSDIRTVQAARAILDAGIADVIILGSESEISAHGIDVSDATIIRGPATFSSPMPRNSPSCARRRASPSTRRASR